MNLCLALPVSWQLHDNTEGKYANHLRWHIVGCIDYAIFIMNFNRIIAADCKSYILK